MTLGKTTWILIIFSVVVRRADESLLPGVYKEVGASFDADPTGLGSLILIRSIVQFLCYPLAAYLAIHHNRIKVIAVGTLLRAVSNAHVAAASTFFEVKFSRVLNGIGLAIVAPAIQSLIADSTPSGDLGKAFGLLHFTGNLGAIIGGLFSLLVSPKSLLGIAGWRLAFHLVGILSVVSGVLVYLFAVDPHFVDKKTGKEETGKGNSNPFWSEIKELAKDAKSVIKIPSFQIIVAQGVAGSLTRSAFAFAPMWLELIGFSSEQTAFLLLIFVVGASLGAVFGGWLGDFLANRYPNSGRIILTQISAALAIPISAILQLVLPIDPSMAAVYSSLLFIMGFSMSWNSSPANNPIFAEIIPEKSRPNIYALDRSLESILSSFAPSTVGFLAQYIYGYKPISTEASSSTQVEMDRENAASLGKALFVVTGAPMTFCFFMCFFLFSTYPKDRKTAGLPSLLL